MAGSPFLVQHTTHHRFMKARTITIAILFIASVALAKETAPISADRIKQDVQEIVNGAFKGAYDLTSFQVTEQKPHKDQKEVWVVEVQVGLLRSDKQFLLPVNKTQEEACTYSYYEELCKPEGTLLGRVLILNYQRLSNGWVLLDPARRIVRKFPLDGFVREKKSD